MTSVRWFSFSIPFDTYLHMFQSQNSRSIRHNTLYNSSINIKHGNKGLLQNCILKMLHLNFFFILKNFRKFSKIAYLSHTRDDTKHFFKWIDHVRNTIPKHTFLLKNMFHWRLNYILICLFWFYLPVSCLIHGKCTLQMWQKQSKCDEL